METTVLTQRVLEATPSDVLEISFVSDGFRTSAGGGFATFIQNGNKVGIFGHPIPELELLRECEDEDGTRAILDGGSLKNTASGECLVNANWTGN